MQIKIYPYLLLGLCVVLSACIKDPGPPVIDVLEPVFGPAETLVVIEGQNLGDIQEITFSGQVVNFNNAYNADHALLMRIPSSVPLGEHEVIFRTPFGSVSSSFRVTLDPPEIFSVNPQPASPGEVITIYGENFFEPLEVYFFDSIQAEIVLNMPDSIRVIVPEGVEKGPITVVANGGGARSPIDFFSINRILVNDFDGDGMRPLTERWIFKGSINETNLTAVQNGNPQPIDNNYLKISGTDDLDISWIGGVQSYFGLQGDDFEDFGIRSASNNTLLELDVNNNGRNDTYVILILLENNGSPNDFAHTVHLDQPGWQRLSIPLNRFKDLNDLIVDPAKVRIVKIFLTDNDDSNNLLEVNVDN
ncbi:MAG: IPT/TIG domain-containing protein, partial [Bacteroidia bacterium]